MEKDWQEFACKAEGKGVSHEGTVSSGTQSCGQANHWGTLRLAGLDDGRRQEAGRKGQQS